MEGQQIMKLFLDTNVLIDYYGRRQPFFSDASKLFVAQAFGDVELWASAKSFTDVFYVIGRQVGESRLQSMFASSFKYLRVCGVDGVDLSDAATRSWTISRTAWFPLLPKRLRRIIWSRAMWQGSLNRAFLLSCLRISCR